MIISPSFYGILNQDVPTPDYQPILFNIAAFMADSGGNIWIPTADGGWGQHGASTVQPLANGGRYITQFKSADGFLYIMGLSPTTGDMTFGSYNVGIYIPSSAGSVSPVEAGAPQAAVDNLTNNQWIGFHRNPASSTITIQKSSDKAIWTDIYTFSNTSGASLEPKLSIFSDGGSTVGKVYFPELFIE